MAKVCQITGRKRMKGNNVSHSKVRTKRDFSLNLKTKRFWSEEEQRFITLKVSCKGMRIIEKNGLEATLRDAQKHPEKYRSLVVRVAGYSALFTTLSKSLQDDIINRTEQTRF